MRRSVDLRYYKHLVDQVPCESQSVGFIFDSLLKQVEFEFLLFHNHLELKQKDLYHPTRQTSNKLLYMQPIPCSH